MSRKSSMLRPGIRRLLGLDVPRKELIVRELEDELQLHLDLRAAQLEKREDEYFRRRSAAKKGRAA